MYKYVGSRKKLFLQYKDGATGRTLEVEPGGEYDVVPTSGLPAVPTGHAASFELVQPKPKKKKLTQDDHDADTMAAESGIDHTESDGE